MNVNKHALYGCLAYYVMNWCLGWFGVVCLCILHTDTHTHTQTRAKEVRRGRVTFSDCGLPRLPYQPIRETTCWSSRSLPRDGKGFTAYLLTTSLVITTLPNYIKYLLFSRLTIQLISSISSVSTIKFHENTKTYFA